MNRYALESKQTYDSNGSTKTCAHGELRSCAGEVGAIGGGWSAAGGRAQCHNDAGASSSNHVRFGRGAVHACSRVWRDNGRRLDNAAALDNIGARRGRGRGRRSSRDYGRVGLRQEGLNTGRKRLVPVWCVASRDARGHLGGEGVRGG